MFGRLRAPSGLLSLALLSFLFTGCSHTPQELETTHLKRGRRFAADKNYKKAVIEFKVASQNMPKDPEPVLQMGMAYLSAGATRLAVEAFEKVLTLDSKNEQATYQLALFKAGSRRPELLDQAKVDIAAWSAKHPNDGEAIATLGLIAAKQGNSAEATRLLDAGLAKDSSLLRIAASAIQFYASQKDEASAKALARDVAEKLPKSPDAAILRAQVSLATRDFDDADAWISHALQLKSDFQPALQLRLRREMMTGDKGSAEGTTQQLSQLPEERMWSAYARILFAEKKYDQGIAEFERALKAHNNDPRLRDDYAATLITANRKKEAEAVADATLAKTPKDLRALLMRASLLIDRGSIDAASKDVNTLLDLKAFSAGLSYQQSRIFAARNETIRQGDLLTEALKYDSRMLVARLELARLLVASGKAKNAIAILDAAPAPQKQSPQFLLDRNIALMADGDWDGARKSVDAALAKGQTSGLLYQDAVLRLRKNDIPGARKSLDTAFSLAPSDAATLNMLGNVMRRQGQYTAYIAMLKAAAGKDPKSAVLQHTLGVVLAREGDNPSARVAFEAAKADGDIVNPEIEIAALDMRTGHPDQARERLLNLVKDHDNARARLVLAEIEINRNSVDAALADYLQAIKLEPTNMIAMNNLAGYLALKQKKYDDALFWGQKALSVAPGNPVVEDTLGWTYYLAGRYDLALPYLEKSLTGADRPLAHYHLAADLVRAGDTARATREYDLALKGDPKSPERAYVDPLFAARR